MWGRGDVWEWGVEAVRGVDVSPGARERHGDVGLVGTLDAAVMHGTPSTAWELISWLTVGSTWERRVARVDQACLQIDHVR